MLYAVGILSDFNQAVLGKGAGTRGSQWDIFTVGVDMEGGGEGRLPAVGIIGC